MTRAHGLAATYKNARCRCQPCTEANHTRNLARRSRGLPSPNDPRHGTVAGYREHGCHCDGCREVGRQLRESRWGTLADDDPRHGTSTGYSVYRCRCEPCLSIYNFTQEQNRKRRAEAAASRKVWSAKDSVR